MGIQVNMAVWVGRLSGWAESDGQIQDVAAEIEFVKQADEQFGGRVGGRRRVNRKSGGVIG